MARKFRPKILADNEPIDYYFADGPIPDFHTPLNYEAEGKRVKLALKMPPEDAPAIAEKNLEVGVFKDVRVAAMVSLIKAAHLSLFEMCGYDYVFTIAGRFVGYDILGEFYLQNLGKSKTEVLDSALPFFREFGSMVRPIQHDGGYYAGTITDGRILACLGSKIAIWAVIVFVRISNRLHAVMTPNFDQVDAIDTFLSFLKNSNDTIRVIDFHFTGQGWRHEDEKAPFEMKWPKDGILYP